KGARCCFTHLIKGDDTMVNDWIMYGKLEYSCLFNMSVGNEYLLSRPMALFESGKSNKVPSILDIHSDEIIFCVVDMELKTMEDLAGKECCLDSFICIWDLRSHGMIAKSERVHDKMPSNRFVKLRRLQGGVDIRVVWDW
ncbi:hypothetical protein Tco_0028887, partial [Tanacetum coccineum]